MGSLLVVFLAPVLDDLSGMTHRQEPVLVQTLVSEPSVKAFNKAVLGWLAGLDEVDMNTVCISPFIHELAGKLRPIVRGNR